MADYSAWKKHGITSDTPDKIMLGAGTIHKGLKYEDGAWNFESSIFGATNGGNKFSITPEITALSIDGAVVKTKGLDIKTGETATMELNLAELTPEIMQKSIFAQIGTSTADGYSVLESKPQIEEGDYFENFAFVGRTAITGKPVIVIFDNALCTSGLTYEGKAKEQSSFAITMECCGNLTGDLDVLPYHIYYPTES